MALSPPKHAPPPVSLYLLLPARCGLFSPENFVSAADQFSPDWTVRTREACLIKPAKSFLRLVRAIEDSSSEWMSCDLFVQGIPCVLGPHVMLPLPSIRLSLPYDFHDRLRSVVRTVPP